MLFSFVILIFICAVEVFHKTIRPSERQVLVGAAAASAARIFIDFMAVREQPGHSLEGMGFRGRAKRRGVVVDESVW